MKRIALNILLAILISGSAATTLGQQPSDDMLSVLKPGQSVKLEMAPTGGFDVVVITEKLVETAKIADKNFRPTMIKKVGRGYVTVTQSIKRGADDEEIDRLIAAHAIHVITFLRDEKYITYTLNGNDSQRNFGGGGAREGRGI